YLTRCAKRRRLVVAEGGRRRDRTGCRVGPRPECRAMTRLLSPKSAVKMIASGRNCGLAIPAEAVARCDATASGSCPSYDVAATPAEARAALGKERVSQ